MNSNKESLIDHIKYLKDSLKACKIALLKDNTTYFNYGGYYRSRIGYLKSKIKSTKKHLKEIEEWKLLI